MFGLAFSGCTMLPGDAKTDGPSIGIGSSSSGGNGVDLEFANINIQPQKGYEFSLYLNLINNQKHPITDLKIKPTGFDWNYVQSGLQREYSENLAAATESGPNQKSLIIEGIVLDGFTDNFNFDPVFKYCYSAKTSYRQQACIPNKLGQCNTDVEKTTTQNGPLKVNVARITPLGDDKIGIEFEVSNSGKGVVVNECFQDANKNNFGNKFELKEAKLGSASGTCKPTSSDSYMINNNQAKFFCEFQRTGDDSYASQINVALEYKYQQEEKKDIVVRDPLVG